MLAPVRTLATSPPPSSLSEHTDEEIIIEDPDMVVDTVQPVTEHEEVAESVPRPSTSERHSSQPLALAIIHPPDQPQHLRALTKIQDQEHAHDSVESSKSSLP